jgi:hypothetical protein
MISWILLITFLLFVEFLFLFQKKFLLFDIVMNRYFGRNFNNKSMSNIIQTRAHDFVFMSNRLDHLLFFVLMTLYFFYTVMKRYCKNNFNKSMSNIIQNGAHDQWKCFSVYQLSKLQIHWYFYKRIERVREYLWHHK